jgi:hypothetical protein
MNSYAARSWMGADTSLAYRQQTSTNQRLPTIAELLTDIHALDAEIQQTNHEIAAQVTANNMAFVNSYWRPFVGYWDGAMREVHDYEHSAPRYPSPGIAAAAMFFWGARARYYDLRRDASARWGFNLDTPTTVGFWPQLLAGGLGALAGALWSNWSWGDRLREGARQGEDIYWHDQLLYVPERERLAQTELWQAFVARRDQDWLDLITRRDQEWRNRMSLEPVTGWPSYAY